MQHRGQESTGIVSSNGKKFFSHIGRGLITQVFSKEIIANLHGHIAIGHNRYATSGGSDAHSQPVLSDKKIIALAHNGTLPKVEKLKEFLIKEKVDINCLNDSELIHMAIEHFVSGGLTLSEAVKKTFPLLTGAFALVIMDKTTMVGVRDSFGIRPFCLGSIGDDGYILSSESCGIESVGGNFIRDVKPGEMITIDENGFKSEELEIGKEKLDIFEVIYFSSPSSHIYGKSLDEMRRNMGAQLAKENSRRSTGEWLIKEFEHSIHFMPTDDLRPHEFDSCWCKPRIEDGYIYVHSALDEREKHESGERKIQ
jgi:amidophosphoribosyltransferase